VLLGCLFAAANATAATTEDPDFQTDIPHIADVWRSAKATIIATYAYIAGV
jgi:hypothetical protein